METVKVEIKSRWSVKALFSADVDASIELGLRVRAALMVAVKSGADLRGAYLSGADLSGAKIYGHLLVGERPILQIGPIGSRCDYLLAFLTKAGIRICAGCFSGTLAEFVAAVEVEHGDNAHGREYKAAIQMIHAHTDIWTREVVEEKAAA